MSVSWECWFNFSCGAAHSCRFVARSVIYKKGVSGFLPTGESLSACALTLWLFRIPLWLSGVLTPVVPRLSCQGSGGRAKMRSLSSSCLCPSDLNMEPSSKSLSKGWVTSEWLVDIKDRFSQGVAAAQSRQLSECFFFFCSILCFLIENWGEIDFWGSIFFCQFVAWFFSVFTISAISSLLAKAYFSLKWSSPWFHEGVRLLSVVVDHGPPISTATHTALASLPSNVQFPSQESSSTLATSHNAFCSCQSSLWD